MRNARSTACAAIGMAFLLMAASVVTATEPVVLTATSDVVPLARATTFAVDADASASAENQFRLIDTDAFKPLPHGNATFGFVDGAYWFHVRLLNRDPRIERRVLVLDYALLDEIDVYQRHDDGSIDHQTSGDFRPFEDRALSYRAPNFWVDFGEDKQIDMLVRIRSKSSMQVPLSVYTQKAFFEMARGAQFGVGLYYGILLALLFYNLILFVSLRDTNYVYYIVHVCGFGLVLFCLNGLAFEYLWPHSSWMANVAVPMSMALSMLGIHQFARMFLNLKTQLPIGNRVIVAFISLHAVMLVLSMFIDYRAAVLIGTAAVFPGAIAILVVSMILARRGYRAAKILLLAWSMMLLGTAMYALVSFGVLPKMFVTEYGIQLGSALEMILLSFALAYRFAVLRNENVRIVRTARNELELRVDERTQELSTAMSELAHANERLRESSLRDGLTGVYNRRHLDATIEPMLDGCRANASPLSVLVADIDHFKRVNDEAGHLVGDDCLRLAASLIEHVVGKNGTVVRYGGEEFVVLLPGLDGAQMQECAEAIRAAVAKASMATAGAPLKMTISIGGATVQADQLVSARTLLQIADDAMYTAKHEGRNRVVVAH